jgi:hypothetical protein
MGVTNIDDIQRELAIRAAIAMARSVVGEDRQGGMIPALLPVAKLSDQHWRKMAEAFVSGWIIERSRQLTRERLGDEATFLAMGEEPEPASLGPVAAVLPQLGDFVERRGLADMPIGGWGRDDIILFARWCADLVVWAETARDERPTDPVINETLMAG